MQEGIDMGASKMGQQHYSKLFSAITFLITPVNDKVFFAVSNKAFTGNYKLKRESINGSLATESVFAVSDRDI